MGFKQDLIHTVADMLATKQEPTCKSCRLSQYDDTRNWHMTCTEFNSHNRKVDMKKPRVASFHLLDSPKDRYFSIALETALVPFFIRKAGMYGLQCEKGMCKAVGNANKDISVLQIHIVEQSDCRTTQEEISTVLDKLSTV